MDAPRIEDGTFEVVVVDAEPVDGDDASVRLELAILAGPRKGELLTVTAAGLGRDALDLLAVPATVVVVDGAPQLTLEG